MHGDRDVLAPVKVARLFQEELQRTSKAGSYYVELPGAQHAFDVFPSARTVACVDAAARFGAHLWNEYRRTHGAIAPS